MDIMTEFQAMNSEVAELADILDDEIGAPSRSDLDFFTSKLAICKRIDGHLDVIMRHNSFQATSMTIKILEIKSNLSRCSSSLLRLQSRSLSSDRLFRDDVDLVTTSTGNLEIRLMSCQREP